jgi:hypothetical protein
MSDGFDERYVSRREHNDVQRENDAAIAAIREKQAGMEARLVHEISAVHQSVQSLSAKLDRALAPPVDHSALAMQRALDVMTKSSGSQFAPLVYMVAGIMLVIGGIFAARLFLMGG